MLTFSPEKLHLIQSGEKENQPSDQSYSDFFSLEQKRTKSIDYETK